MILERLKEEDLDVCHEIFISNRKDIPETRKIPYTKEGLRKVLRSICDSDHIAVKVVDKGRIVCVAMFMVVSALFDDSTVQLHEIALNSDTRLSKKDQILARSVILDFIDEVAKEKSANIFIGSYEGYGTHNQYLNRGYEYISTSVRKEIK